MYLINYKFAYRFFPITINYVDNYNEVVLTIKIFDLCIDQFDHTLLT